MLLIWNFIDTHFMSPVYLLETPIEISTFEFHPENPNIIIGRLVLSPRRDYNWPADNLELQRSTEQAESTEFCQEVE